MAETQLEKCLECVINIFHQYSIRVDHFDMLSKGELKQLLEQQLPNFLKKHKDAASKCMAELDKDRNNQLDFGEFMGIITKVLIWSHDNIHKKDDQGQDPGHKHSHSHGP